MTDDDGFRSSMAGSGGRRRLNGVTGDREPVEEDLCFPLLVVLEDGSLSKIESLDLVGLKLPFVLSSSSFLSSIVPSSSSSESSSSSSSSSSFDSSVNVLSCPVESFLFLRDVFSGCPSYRIGGEPLGSLARRGKFACMSNIELISPSLYNRPNRAGDWRLANPESSSEEGCAVESEFVSCSVAAKHVSRRTFTRMSLFSGKVIVYWPVVCFFLTLLSLSRQKPLFLQACNIETAAQRSTDLSREKKEAARAMAETEKEEDDQV